MTKMIPDMAGRDLVWAIKNPELLGNIPLKHWDGLLRVAKRANLIGRLSKNVKQQKFFDELPEPVRNQLYSAGVLTSHQRAAIDWETRHIARALEPIGVPIILLKGAAYVLANRTAADGRLFGDVDILVPRAQLNSVEAALMVHGWASGQVDSYDERYYRQWMHEIPPMTHCERGTVIDVHHNILPSTSRTVPNVELLHESSQPIPGTIFRVLCPVDMIIHSAVHLFHESELQNGLRDLFDLDSLIKEFSGQGASFWQDLVDRSILLGQVLPLYLALRYTKAILASETPEQINVLLERETRLGQLELAVLDTVYLHALMPDRPDGNDISTLLARFAVFLRGHYLRMPLGLLSMHLIRKFFLRLFRNTSRSI